MLIGRFTARGGEGVQRGPAFSSSGMVNKNSEDVIGLNPTNKMINIYNKESTSNEKYYIKARYTRPFKSLR